MQLKIENSELKIDGCHPERSEGSRYRGILRFAQNDKNKYRNS
jgi:hypothetical protein